MKKILSIASNPRLCRLLLQALSILLILTLCIANSYAQTKKRHPLSLRDSLRRALLRRDSVMRSYKQTDGSLNSLLAKIEYYTNLYNEDKSDFARGYDTTDLSQKLPTVEKRMKFMGNLIENDQSSTLGYLFTIRDIMDHINDEVQDWQTSLNEDNSKLERLQDDVSAFKKDSILHVVPADSSLRITYLSETGETLKKWSRLDSAVKKSLIRIGSLQNRVTAVDILMLDIKDRINLKINDFSLRSLTNEYGFIWNTHTNNLSRTDRAISKTYALNYKLLKYFIDPKTTSHTNLISHCLTLISFLAFFFWIQNSRKKLLKVKENHQDVFEQTKYVIRNQFLSAFLIASILGLYFYDQPPFIFLEILMLLMMVSMGIMIKPVWHTRFFKLWQALLGLFILFALTNLFIQESLADRWFLFILSICSIVAGALFLSGSKEHEETGYPPYTCLAIRIFVICQSISLFLNIMGRLSLSKIIGVAATFNLCLAFGFYLLIQVIMECLFIQLEANKTANSSFISYIDFKVVQNKFKSVLIGIACILWLIKLAENLDVDDFIFSRIGDFLSHPYKFGTTAFTLGSIVIFVFVLWISILISRVITYFYDYAQQQAVTGTDFKKTKTSILLIRLSVYVIGFFAAVMFSGIPMDRITIILGALGVGIGFGLQNIVNNLVSGVILAFERPVQVGDIIEVGNRSGTIKEIGIRASKIEAGDGSELIVPNGDLISQHVINWTLSNNNRRVELIVGVAYGSDINKVEALLKSIIRNRQDIMQTPAPLVFLHNFSESSVDFRLWFWIVDINTSLTLKSRIMGEIYTAFAKEGIEIPHPKRDIQVFFPEGTSAEIKQPEKIEIANKNQKDPAH
jgi:small-conductance mechanosensitive channel